MKTFEKLFYQLFDKKDIRKIDVNNRDEYFSTEDKDIPFKMLKTFNWMDNYYMIYFHDNYDELCIWDYNNFDTENSNQKTEQFNEYLKDLMWEFSVQELNDFIEPLIKLKTNNIY